MSFLNRRPPSTVGCLSYVDLSVRGLKIEDLKQESILRFGITTRQSGAIACRVEGKGRGDEGVSGPSGDLSRGASRRRKRRCRTLKRGCCALVPTNAV